ncbi:kinase-like domain-containing protein [Aspergillus pseudoustus]|uniref:Kinase-like domain-containing protein n=1 Tax=Aspergillus pseudoustus TaxID=1810923 RepID=A0ABR4K1J6_9EURO
MSNAQLARDMISTTHLSPTEHLILAHFLDSANDSETAARYLLSQTQGTQPSQDLLRRFISRWRNLVTRTAFDPISNDTKYLVFERDGEGFAMRIRPSHVPNSNAEPAYVIPPTMFQGLDSAENASLFELLKAFLSPAVVASLRGLVEANEKRGSLENVILLPPSIHKAFRAGHVTIKRQSDILNRSVPGCVDGYHEKYLICREYPEPPRDLYLGDGSWFTSTSQWFELSTSEPQVLPLPSNLLLNVHRRFAAALHQFFILDKANRGWTRQPRGLSLPAPVRHLFKSLWLGLPQRLRVLCYALLGKLGQKLYPLEASVWAQRLPFGLYAKKCYRAPENEPYALKLIEQHTSIPAPRLIDTWEHNGTPRLLMTRVPGVPVWNVCHLMSYAEREQFANDVRACVDQLRKIPNPNPYLICNALGGEIRDHRIPNDGRGGPFKTEEDFNNHLTSHLGEPLSDVAKRKNLPLRKHTHFYFTHSDFHPSNLLVENGRLSGIVDWESAGFRPEYWEFTKAMYGSSMANPGVMNPIWRRIFEHQYEPEFELEQQLWYLTPFGS